MTGGEEMQVLVEPTVTMLFASNYDLTSEGKNSTRLEGAQRLGRREGRCVPGDCKPQPPRRGSAGPVQAGPHQEADEGYGGEVPAPG